MAEVRGLNEIVITTGARLHFGLLAHGQAAPREFGGIGVMIDRPGFVIRAALADADDLRCGLWESRAAELLRRLRFPAESAARERAPSLALEIVQAPPPHVGLGSGTQLAMAVARIVSLFAGETGLPAAELARRADRGVRSAIGLYGFERGGLLLEAGHRDIERISPLAARVEFPEKWRFVLVRPRDSAGVSGGEEARNFGRLPGMDAQLTNRLCRIALLEILPAVIESDFEDAAGAIGQFGRLVGQYFAPVQGGVFADPQMALLTERLAERGIRGVGQTSWGPTIFILCPDEDGSGALCAELARDRELAGCEITTAAPLNRGATIQ